MYVKFSLIISCSVLFPHICEVHFFFLFYLWLYYYLFVTTEVVVVVLWIVVFFFFISKTREMWFELDLGKKQTETCVSRDKKTNERQRLFKSPTNALLKHSTNIHREVKQVCILLYVVWSWSFVREMCMCSEIHVFVC